MLGGEIGRQQPPSEKPDQAEFVDAERIEQIEIVHDVVVDAGSCAGSSSASPKPGWSGTMTRNFCVHGSAKLMSVPNAGAVKKHQRFARPAV